MKALAVAVLLAAAPVVLAQPAPEAAPTVLSSSAEKVYAYARPRLVQVRTLLAVADRQASLGSAFLVDADGLAITNYHVVSRFALEPGTYKLEYRAPDGTSGPLELLAFDVVRDLAVVRLGRRGLPWFAFDERALDGSLPKGERLFSMGNPLDLGFTIVEGTYNGLVEKSYIETIHFSGAINAGMSGGPTVTAEGRVAGINVAVNLRGQLVSLLVPARHAAELLRRARDPLARDGRQARAELGRQLSAWQSRFHADLSRKGFVASRFGPYHAPEADETWFQCWAATNADNVPKPRTVSNRTQCRARNAIFITDAMNTGDVHFTHEHLASASLNAFQFANAVEARFGAGAAHDRGGSLKHLTRQDCVENHLAGDEAAGRPAARVRWCARAYRDFDGLYDFTLSHVTQDRAAEALVSSLSIKGFTWDNGTALARRFLGEIRWAR